MPLFEVDNVDGSACGAEIDLLVSRLHVVFRVLPVQHEMPGSPRNRVLHQRARKPQALAVIGRAKLDAGHNTGRDRLAKADFLQQLQRRLVDATNVMVGERLEFSARKPGPHRLDVVGQRL